MKQSFKRVLLPTIGQAVGCLGVAVALIGFLYRQQILQRIQQGSGIQVFGQLNYGETLASVTNSPIIHTAVIIGFWSGVGLVAYTIVWSIINVMIEARNEVVLETEYTNKSALAQRIRTPLLQLALAAGLFVGLLVGAKWVFPFWLGMANTALRATGALPAVGYGLLSVFGMGLTIYLLVLMAQLVFWLG